MLSGVIYSRISHLKNIVFDQCPLMVNTKKYVGKDNNERKYFDLKLCGL